MTDTEPTAETRAVAAAPVPQTLAELERRQHRMGQLGAGTLVALVLVNMAMLTLMAIAMFTYAGDRRADAADQLRRDQAAIAEAERDAEEASVERDALSELVARMFAYLEDNNRLLRILAGEPPLPPGVTPTPSTATRTLASSTLGQAAPRPAGSTGQRPRTPQAPTAANPGPLRPPSTPTTRPPTVVPPSTKPRPPSASPVPIPEPLDPLDPRLAEVCTILPALCGR